MTDVDELPPTLASAPALDAHAPVLLRRRRNHRPIWWVLATVVLGALIGSGLAVLAGSVEPEGGAATGTSPTTTGAPGAAFSAGAAQRQGESAAPALHSIDNRVFVVGDSVMQGAAPYLGDLLEGWSIIADTRVGRFIDEANRVIAKRRKDIGQIAVLNLGNNYNGDEAAFAQQVDFALAALADVEHVIWVNVGEFEDDRSEVNDVVAKAAASHPNVTIVDWNSWWEEDPSLTGGDHLHLTPEGAKAYATLVASTILKVTEEAGEIPAPGAKPPKLNTSGKIPDSSSPGSKSGSKSPRSGSGARSSTHRSSSPKGPSTGHTATTGEPAPAETVPATAPPATSPPATSPPATNPPATVGP